MKDQTNPAFEFPVPMKCRLLYLVGQLGIGGLERQLFLLLRSMERERYHPEVVVWNFREDDAHVPRLRALNVPIHCFSDVQSKASKLSALRRMILQLKPELVHSYSFYTNFAAWCATLGTKTIAVGSARSDFAFDKLDSGPLLGRLSARWPRNQIYNNLLSAETVSRSNSLFVPKQFVMVRNGVDLQSFQMRPLSTANGVRIVGIGSLLAAKRWDRLLIAAVKLKLMGLNFLIRIAGDGPLRGTLQKQTEELGLADRIKLLGYIDDIPGLLSNSTFLVHTSDIEGCPNAILEALACGRAVVSTDAGDIPYLVEDGKSGFVVPRGDDRALVDRLSKLIIDHDLCRSMGIAGRRKAEREFGIDRLVNETLGAYQTAGWKKT